MKDNKDAKRSLLNAEGKRILEQTRLDYSKEIIYELYKSPEIMDDVINDLEITDEEFFNNISGDLKANITFYDQALTLTRDKQYKKNKK